MKRAFPQPVRHPYRVFRDGAWIYVFAARTPHDVAYSATYSTELRAGDIIAVDHAGRPSYRAWLHPDGLAVWTEHAVEKPRFGDGFAPVDPPPVSGCGLIPAEFLGAI